MSLSCCPSLCSRKMVRLVCATCLSRSWVCGPPAQPVILTRDHDLDLDTVKGQHWPHACRLLSGDFVAGFTPDRPAVLACRRQVLDQEEVETLRGLLGSAATTTPHRGPAAGPIRKLWRGYRLVNAYSMDRKRGTRNVVNQKVNSGTVGYNKDGSPTAWTRRNPDALRKAGPLLQKCGDAYRRTLPFAWDQQAAVGGPRIGATPFRMLFVNRNFRTAVHRDKNVGRSAMGVMLVVGTCAGGGRIQFPEVSVEVDVQPGDLLMFEPGMWHCNTAITQGSDRVSIICHG